MRDVSHTPPTGDRELNTVFSRGPRAMTDGGQRRDETNEPRDDEADVERMKDVSHTPPAEDREVDRVFARGHERLASDEVDEHDHERGRVAGEVAEE